MLKEERLKFIKDYLSTNQIIKVQDIVTQLNITDMTVRRDLIELEKDGFLERIHGGAKLITDNELTKVELSHMEKKQLHLKEKQIIAQKIANEIEENDIVFLGTGTTTELVYDYLKINNAKFITNSVFVFDKFKHDPRFDLVLIGGSYRHITGAFIGTIASDYMENIFVHKAFIGVNALDNQYLYNANEDEGQIQRIALTNARTKYIVADYSKFDKNDFYRFYKLNNIDYILTDSHLSNSLINEYTANSNVQIK
ncbi:DeoR/GlpR transcriptional regulator [Aerococcaceae bacterium zg-BR9]|uniref:DeoR/GlpR family DNA-binding transcription regulator n=1 Tax=Aerococcaceae bacterium zg-1292 TaxID=2774330 RepID=UPI004063E06E|nr:DeoR/GlpR transcriptional regulator [Aerococcaceae bacterium zg-BR9]